MPLTAEMQQYLQTHFLDKKVLSTSQTKVATKFVKERGKILASPELSVSFPTEVLSSVHHMLDELRDQFLDGKLAKEQTIKALKTTHEQIRQFSQHQKAKFLVRDFYRDTHALAEAMREIVVTTTTMNSWLASHSAQILAQLDEAPLEGWDLIPRDQNGPIQDYLTGRYERLCELQRAVAECPPPDARLTQFMPTVQAQFNLLEKCILDYTGLASNDSFWVQVRKDMDNELRTTLLEDHTLLPLMSSVQPFVPKQPDELLDAYHQFKQHAKARIQLWIDALEDAFTVYPKSLSSADMTHAEGATDGQRVMPKEKLEALQDKPHFVYEAKLEILRQMSKDMANTLLPDETQRQVEAQAEGISLRTLTSETFDTLARSKHPVLTPELQKRLSDSILTMMENGDPEVRRLQLLKLLYDDVVPKFNSELKARNPKFKGANDCSESLHKFMINVLTTQNAAKVSADCRELVMGGEVYVMAGELGRGGEGFVNRMVSQNPPHKAVVLKGLLSESNESRQSLCQEAITLLQLKKTPDTEPGKKNIIGIESVAFDELGAPYIVMEEVRGRDMEKQRTALTAGAGLGVVPATLKNKIQAKQLKSVLQALLLLKKKNMLHFDIKPANILVTESGEPKLIDFGTSEISASADGSVPSRSAVTPQYSNRKVLRKGERYDQREDGFSLGMMMARIFTDTPSGEDVNVQKGGTALNMLLSQIMNQNRDQNIVIEGIMNSSLFALGDELEEADMELLLKKLKAYEMALPQNLEEFRTQLSALHPIAKSMLNELPPDLPSVSILEAAHNLQMKLIQSKTHETARQLKSRKVAQDPLATEEDRQQANAEVTAAEAAIQTLDVALASLKRMLEPIKSDAKVSAAEQELANVCALIEGREPPSKSSPAQSKVGRRRARDLKQPNTAFDFAPLLQLKSELNIFPLLFAELNAPWVKTLFTQYHWNLDKFMARLALFVVMPPHELRGLSHRADSELYTRPAFQEFNRELSNASRLLRNAIPQIIADVSPEAHDTQLEALLAGIAQNIELQLPVPKAPAQPPPHV